MTCFIFFIYLFMFCFSKMELCSARYLSSSGPLHHSTTKEAGLMPPPQDSNGASFKTATRAQADAAHEQERNQKEKIEDDNVATNKSVSNVGSSAEEVQPSFDYSDYSRPRTRPPSHN